MRYFLFSGIVHLILVVAGLFVLSDTLDFQQAGDPSVSFTMVGENTHAGGSSSNPVSEPVTEKKQEQAVEEKVVKEEIPKEEVVQEVVEEVIEEPIVVEEVIEVPVEETPEEIIEPVEKVEEVVEIVDEAPEVVEEPTEEISSEVTETTENTSNLENTSENANQSDTKDESSKTLGEGLVHLDDGSIAAKNQGVKGLEYGFLSQPEPSYPDIARRMGVNEDVIIKVRFLIGYNGRVEDIKYYDNVTNFGFRSEVEKALSSWRATPITVDGEPVKLYFYKSFKFEKL